MNFNEDKIKELLEWGILPYEKRKESLEEADQDFDFKEYEDYNIRLQLSKNAQKDSNIVIIDPDIETIEDLEAKYDSFTKLIQKFKIFSNNYSYQLWGYNVVDMYRKLVAKIGTASDKVEDDNVAIVGESTKLDNYFNAVQSSNNYIDHIMTEYVFTIEENTPGISTSNKYIWERKVEESNNSMNNISVNSNCPWFTMDECIDMGIALELESARWQFKDYDDRNDLLKIAWNPELPYNAVTIEAAQNRQRNWINEHQPKIIDFTNKDVGEVSNSVTMNETSYPVYLVLDDPIPTNHTDLFNIGIAFDPELNIIYIPDMDSNVFHGFIATTLSDMKQDTPFNVVVVFLDKTAYDNLKKNINANNFNPYDNTSVLYWIYPSYSKFDMSIEKFAYFMYMNFLYRLSGGKNYMNSEANVYKVYNGNKDNYNSEIIHNKVNLLYNSSRAILYSAQKFKKFAEAATTEAERKAITKSIRGFMENVFNITNIYDSIVEEKNNNLETIETV